ncbi:V-set and transmembrane domain-containing protein 2A-like, partial [Stegastes partitus]|uniref:V-set and transmembrane domain-containing protein 2A-like n=1 Tax=Stegastes partitus TaxID=144197 RepID=A0A9Y4K9M0_9TELE
VVKVVGSNISHKLRLSRVKPSDEGTYECRVIDFSDYVGARHHRVRAYLQVVPEGDATASNHHNNNFRAPDDTKRGVGFTDVPHGGTREHSQHQNHGHNQEHGKRPSSPAHHGHSHGGSSSQQHKAGRELKKRDMDSNHNHNDCSNEPSCAP